MVDGDTLEVAVKTVAHMNKKERSNFRQEMIIMSKIVHPNVVRLYGLIPQGKLINGQWSEYGLWQCHGDYCPKMAIVTIEEKMYANLFVQSFFADTNRFIMLFCRQHDCVRIHVRRKPEGFPAGENAITSIFKRNFDYTFREYFLHL